MNMNDSPDQIDPPAGYGNQPIHQESSEDDDFELELEDEEDDDGETADADDATGSDADDASGDDSTDAARERPYAAADDDSGDAAALGAAHERSDVGPESQHEAARTHESAGSRAPGEGKPSEWDDASHRHESE